MHLNIVDIQKERKLNKFKWKSAAERKAIMSHTNENSFNFLEHFDQHFAWYKSEGKKCTGQIGKDCNI